MIVPVIFFFSLINILIDFLMKVHERSSGYNVSQYQRTFYHRVIYKNGEELIYNVKNQKKEVWTLCCTKRQTFYIKNTKRFEPVPVSL